MLVHLLKIWLWPGSQALNHWHGEIVALQKNAARRCAPSMRQRIELVRLCDDAIEQLEASGEKPGSSRRWPTPCPFTLDQLLRDKWVTLEDCLNAVATARQDDARQTSVTPGMTREG